MPMSTSPEPETNDVVLIEKKRKPDILMIITLSLVILLAGRTISGIPSSKIVYGINNPPPFAEQSNGVSFVPYYR